MAYMHEQFPYPPQQSQQPMFFQPGTYPPYLQQPQPFDEHYMQYGHPEYTEYLTQGAYHDEYDDANEVATRPRLTREQVEVLEAQFQANHKPNSTVKRQLALQTNLSLPRVANWFQNRRAKAKQQKRQEEFENNHGASGARDEDSTAVKDGDDQGSDDEEESFKQRIASGEESAANNSSDLAARDAGWASLQRALVAAKVAQTTTQPSTQPRPMSAMQPAEVKQEPNMATSHVGMRDSMAMQDSPQGYARKHSLADTWTSQQVFQDHSFDFGFGEQHAVAACPPPAPILTETSTLTQDHSLISPSDTWNDGLPTPRGNGVHQLDLVHPFQSPDLPLPAYPESRRGSGADSLTHTFDAFALASDSPHALSTPGSGFPTHQADGQLDLAARRKRPRPAALTSSALRSRSYGAMTSMSPTYRPSMTPAMHTIRHVKSTGHSLNARFSGIRKPNSAQRSPINVSTFAEAEAFNRLMAQQAATAQSTVPSTSDISGPLLSPAMIVNTDVNGDYGPGPMAHRMDLASRYQLPTTQHLTLLTSPPTTPFAHEFDPASQAAFAMPPVSAPPQYATFPDYTPPYSAGPLTNSSWSDAPLTSPDLPNFPPVSYIPSLGHAQKSDSISGHFSEFILTSDAKHEIDGLSNTQERKTDFFIQEFPNQKQEHANIAKQLTQQRPKNYVFANTAPSDYDQSQPQ